MFTDNKTLQFLQALLKAHGVRHLVISPGSRNAPLARSVEQDDHFQCYSVVDERSAAYYALGIALQTGEPVALSCTIATASCNYLPAVVEAFHRGIPLILLTGDSNPYLVGQLESQMIDQSNTFSNFVKKSVWLPVVRTREDEWYCQRLINEALLASSHHGSGPVHIRVPIVDHFTDFTTAQLPPVKTIFRIDRDASAAIWEEKAALLRSKKKILVVYGQGRPASPQLKAAVEKFCSATGAVVIKEHTANISPQHAIPASLAMEGLTEKSFEPFAPEIVISVGGNYVSSLKALLRSRYGQYHHWLVNDSGEPVDTFKSLDSVFECPLQHFFEYFATHASQAPPDTAYLEMWMARRAATRYPDVEFSNVTAIKAFLERIPSDSILNLSILNSARIAQFWEIPDTVETYSNLGAYGIDGCLSTFLGQASATSKLCFLIIGDLSFFYDMNALSLRNIGSHVRILLINNFGGGEFHLSFGKAALPNIDQHTAAAHTNTAKAWAEDNGFQYYSAHKQCDLDTILPEFVSPSQDRPMFLEVFTHMENDAQAIQTMFEANRAQDGMTKAWDTAKSAAKSLLGNKAYDSIRRKMGKN
ncbi:MAG: 2-succinyl-5-enolpyruvyl-6-hydroxy-3-cyclohexene-1-carboxylic-acid synthase [Ruminococcaceae bacterium]|nr:2-succinyl-5-enolpyruvyl-6-hydroxy-3-cyclohexene-1-carboxylic-acid synthase [Oscillospiraceae bacterium]